MPVELEFYNILFRHPQRGFPYVISIENQTVKTKVYSKITNKNYFTNETITVILQTLQKISDLGYSHNAVHINHILDDDGTPILIDYGKISKIGKKPHLFSIHNINFLSRNIMNHGTSNPLDDLESFGYTLLFIKKNKIISTLSAKEIFVENILIDDVKLKQYFSLIRNKCTNHQKYINIFK
nr:MAG: casein kinase [Diabrotica toursvirus 3a]